MHLAVQQPPPVGTAYRTLVANALTYVANFTGVGTYAVFDSSLGVIFGVPATGYLFTALCDPPPRCAI